MLLGTVAALFFGLPVPAAALSGSCATDHSEARRLLEAGQLAAALPLLEKTYAACPADQDNARDLAAAEIDSGQPESARPIVVALLRQQDAAGLHSLLGRVESAEKNYRAAALQYQMAAQMDSSESNVFDYGTTLYRLDYNAAATILRFGVSKYPKSVRMHVALGTALYALSIPEEGARQFCTAEELDPSDPHPMELLAQTAAIPPSLAPRVTSMLAALHQRYPRDGLILFDYTMAKSGRWTSQKDALPPGFVQSVRAALALNPRIPDAWYQLALISEDQKNYADEIRLLQKAIALDPRKPDYYYHLAFAFRDSGNQEKFRALMRQFQEMKAASAPHPAP